MNIELKFNLDDIHLDKEFKEEITAHVRQVIFELVEEAVRRDKRMTSIVNDIRDAVLAGVKPNA